MATIDAMALEQVLGAVDLRVGIARRVALRQGERMPLGAEAAALVYVSHGSVSGHPSNAYRFDAASALVFPSFVRSSLGNGDALVALGGHRVDLVSDADTELMVVDLELSDAAMRLRSVLPEVISVTGFDVLEPAAAALAENMGANPPEVCALRSGDPVICRMMAMTVLLSVIRAWAENGCAPEGWPSISKDPFLDRVVDAIHDDPGRGWTVELLASVGAMSRSVFAERFRTVLGCSPASYVTEVRMDVAKRMLDAGLPVSATSRELGYASDEGFSRAFRRATGVTPSSWRAAQREPMPA